MVLERFARGSVMILGRPIPKPVAALGAAAVACSLLGAFVPPLARLGLLIPARVFAGEVWRLATWVLLDVSPLSLLFAVFMLGMFGADVCRAWGPARFLASVLALAVLPAVVTCLVARLFFEGRLLGLPYLSLWPVVEGLTIAWALLYPARPILFFFFVPTQGRTLVWVTIGAPVFFAVFQGWDNLIPHLVAPLLALAMFDPMRFTRRLWLRVRLAAFERELRRRGSHLRVVGKDRDGPSRWVH